jgi:AhpD family alkylhydroperoxidase
MQPRVAYTKVAPGAMKTMRGLEDYRAECCLEPSLLDLVRTRASQINGCAYCIDMYTKDARARGETEQRLYELVACREAPFSTERERAAQAWTEAMTLVSVDPVPDETYAAVLKQFTKEELVYLTLTILSINGWNRLAINFRMIPTRSLLAFRTDEHYNEDIPRLY